MAGSTPSTGIKISINLLPQEVLLQRVQNSKLVFINKVSIAVLVFVIILTGGVFALKISQNNLFTATNQKLSEAENQVGSMKQKEEQLYILKKRLASIEALLGTDEKIKTMFNLLLFTIPQGVIVNEITLDKNSNMAVSLSSSSLASIQALFNNLSNKEKIGSLISKVDLDGISLGKDNTYRFSIKIIASKDK
jgi:Tfp pilus assembly protein PilN